jgi:arginine metabolism regulation protein II
MILQSIIDDVIKALQDYDQALKQQGLEISGTAWPALIAGSEAESKIQRDQIMAWIDTRILATGFGSYYTVKEIVEEVWVRRDGASNLTT